MSKCCKRCGSVNDDAMLFCSACGAYLTPMQDSDCQSGASDTVKSSGYSHTIPLNNDSCPGSVKNCHRCGTQLPVSASVCDKCGQLIIVDKETNNNGKKKRSVILIVAAVLAVSILVGGAFAAGVFTHGKVPIDSSVTEKYSEKNVTDPEKDTEKKTNEDMRSDDSDLTDDESDINFTAENDSRTQSEANTDTWQDLSDDKTSKYSCTVSFATPGHAGLNLREKPLSTSELICLIPEGAAVTVFGQESNGYVFVNYYLQGRQYSGWLLKSYLIKDTADVKVNMAVISSNTPEHAGLVVRAEATYNSAKITVLAEGTKLILQGKAANGYAFIRTEDGSVEGWVLETYLINY